MLFKRIKILSKLQEERILKDMMILGISALSFFLLIVVLDLFVLRNYIAGQLDHEYAFRFILFLIMMVVMALIFGYRRYQDYQEEVSLRKIAESNMQKSKAQLQAVLDGVPDIILQVDTNLRILWANKAALERNPDSIGIKADHAFSTLGSSVVDRYSKASMSTGIIEKGIDYQPTMIGVEGESYWEGIGVPLYDSNDKIFGAIAIARDLTDRMRTEHTWNLLASIVESTDDAIYGIGFDGTILSWNRGAETTYGYRGIDIIGKPVVKLLNPEEANELIQKIDKVIRKQKIERFEQERRRIDGSKIIAAVTLCPFVDATGKKIGVSAIERNVTESRKAEEALIESEQRFRQMAETISDAYWLTDLISDRILFVNPAYERIWGRPSEGLKHNTKDWLKAVHPDDSEKIKQVFKYQIENNGMDEEFRIIHSDGSIHWVRDRSFLIRNKFGNVYRIAGVTQDITKQKEAEEALKLSEARYRELFENMSSGVYVLEAFEDGQDFILRDFNTAGQVIENLNKSDVLGKKISELIPGGRNQGLFKVIYDVWKTGKPKDYLLTVKEDNKIVSWRDNYIYKLRTGEIVAIYDDITDRVAAQEALRKSEEKFRTLVTLAPDGIVMTNQYGNIIEVNEAFERVFGYHRRELMDERLPEFIEDTKYRQIAEKLIFQDTPEMALRVEEIIVRNKSDKEVPVELSVASLYDEFGKISGIIMVLRDVTIRKKFELELKESREQMRHLAIHLQSVIEEERKRIAFEIHDELGYALTALKLDLSWLSKKHHNDSKLAEKSKSMNELIETMIQKVRTISTQLRPSILDHFGLIAAIEWQANEFQKRTACRCRLNINNPDFEIKDPFATAIFRIFQETLTNITRHSNASRVDVNLSSDEEFLYLEIRDNGKGFDTSQIGKKKSLGLVGMRERADSIGALIKIDSIIGEGTSISLNIPYRELEEKYDKDYNS